MLSPLPLLLLTRLLLYLQTLPIPHLPVHRQCLCHSVRQFPQVRSPESHLRLPGLHPPGPAHIPWEPVQRK